MKLSRFARFSIALLFVWIVLFAFLPQIMVLIASVLSKGATDFILFEPTVQNYARLFDPIYLQIFVDSLVLASVTTLLCLIIAFPFAATLARAPKAWRPLLLILVIIPFWTSSLVRTYALIALLKTKGLINAALLFLGIIDAPLELMYTQVAVFIGMVYTLLPFMILPLYAALEKIDVRLIEAASDLGAGFWSRLMRITIPLSLSGIIAGSMLVFLPALGMFYIPDLLGGAKNLIIGSFIRNQFLTFRDWPFGAAASMLLSLMMLLMVALYAYAQRRERA
ncbi:MAG: ABC transporter permease subunit [Campylobacterales bacterium]|nr:ABC transporter permease subunit [Campylobacterales bacterium]